MKIVYIAGPYMAKDWLGIERNIAQAREAAARLAQNGIGYFCPHLNSAHFEVITPYVGEAFWKELDLKMLAACNALMLLPGWIHSSGSVAERAEAERLCLPVFYPGEDAGLGLWAAS